MGLIRDLKKTGATGQQIGRAAALSDFYLPIIPGSGINVTPQRGSGAAVALLPEANTYLDQFLAIVVGEGPAEDADDLEQDQYWVKRAFVAGRDAVQTDEPATEKSYVSVSPDEPSKDADGNYVEPFIVCATNLAELGRNIEIGENTERETGNHSVPVGTVVRIFAVYDRQQTQRKRYFFYHHPGPFMVRVEEDGDGIDGDEDSAATFTYDVSTLHGEVIGEGVPLVIQRANGSVVAGSSYGIAFWDNGDLKLWDAGERPNTEPCSGS